MAGNSSYQNPIPENVMKLMVEDVFRKNNVKPEEVKNNITNEQKQMLKTMVEDLKTQVEHFNNGEQNTNRTNE